MRRVRGRERHGARPPVRRALGLGGLALACAAPGLSGQTAVRPPAPLASLGAAADAIASADYEAALAALKGAEGVTASDARARALALLGRYAKAEAAAEEGGAHIALGEIRAARGDLEGAAAAFSVGLASSDSVQALVGLAKAVARAGRSREAGPLFERALGAYGSARGDAPALMAVAEAASELGGERYE
ncbi:MAG: hypothetical protein ABFS41_13055, partial [Myxococcota bacterium]